MDLSDQTAPTADKLDLRYPAASVNQDLRDMLLARGRVMIGVRPYAVRRAAQGAPAQVVANQWLGDQSHIAASFAGKSIVLVEHDRAILSEGAIIHVQINLEDLHVFDPDTGAALAHGQALANGQVLAK